MPYLDSKIVGFINFFYDEVEKNKMPWRIKVSLYNNHRIPTTLCPYSYDGVIIEIIHTNIDLGCKKCFAREQLTLPKASPEDLAKCAFEEIRKEFDHWTLERHWELSNMWRD